MNPRSIDGLLKQWGYSAGYVGLWSNPDRDSGEIKTRRIAQGGIRPRYRHHQILKLLAENGAWWTLDDIVCLSGFKPRQVESVTQALRRIDYLDRAKKYAAGACWPSYQYRATEAGCEAANHPLEYLQRRLAGDHYR